MVYMGRDSSLGPIDAVVFAIRNMTGITVIAIEIGHYFLADIHNTDQQMDARVSMQSRRYKTIAK